MLYKRYKMLQKYINGEAQEEYKQGELISDVTFNTLDACNEGNQKPDEPIEGNEYQWVTVVGDYICYDGDKYSKQKEQRSSDGGVTWTDTGKTRKGDLIGTDSEDCSFDDKYLTTEHITNGTVQIHRYVSIQDYSDKYPLTNIQYSKNGGAWTSITYDTDISVSRGDKIEWKANANVNNGVYNTCYTEDNDCVMSIFRGTSDFNVSGNIKSLIYNDDFKTIDETGKTIQLSWLFYAESEFGGNSCVVSAENLLMPVNIYKCRNMFGNQTKMTTAPSVLPATELTTQCYEAMFYGCTSLVNAPVLPATTLVFYCYRVMFNGCTNLTSITCLATDISAFSCTEDWVRNVASRGTFTKAANMTSWTTGDDGIPSGWTVVTE